MVSFIGETSLEKRLNPALCGCREGFGSAHQKIWNTSIVYRVGPVRSPPGWEGYAEYLAWQAEEGPAGKSKAYVNLNRGWALGTAGFKATLQAAHARSH